MWKMPRQDPLLATLNKLIDKRFHKYFDDPELCIFAIGADVIMHQAVESMFGLTEMEIARRTVRYLPKGIGEMSERDG